jgi:hypothetical protein
MWELAGPIVLAAMQLLSVRARPKETLPREYFEELENENIRERTTGTDQ